ncbi:hypothetical protein P692DRAFT_201873060 [Suillus brevipes Sb2]|nr:hypothetical protein P692DRAFT_201873060 [Suillus brevipes Sb2]
MADDVHGTQRHSRTSQSFSAQRSALMPILMPILAPILASILVPILAPILAPILVLNLVPILCHATLPQAEHDDLFAVDLSFKIRASDSYQYRISPARTALQTFFDNELVWALVRCS